MEGKERTQKQRLPEVTGGVIGEVIRWPRRSQRWPSCRSGRERRRLRKRSTPRMIPTGLRQFSFSARFWRGQPEGISRLEMTVDLGWLIQTEIGLSEASTSLFCSRCRSRCAARTLWLRWPSRKGTRRGRHLPGRLTCEVKRHQPDPPAFHLQSCRPSPRCKHQPRLDIYVALVAGASARRETDDTVEHNEVLRTRRHASPPHFRNGCHELMWFWILGSREGVLPGC